MAIKGGVTWFKVVGELAPEIHLPGYFCLYCQREVFPDPYASEGQRGLLYVHDHVDHPSDFNQCDENIEM